MFIKAGIRGLYKQCVHYVLSANEHQAEKLSLGFTFRVGSCAIDFQTESILAQK